MEQLDVIQAEQKEWSERNFGKQPAHRPLLGIIEELCEFEESGNREEMLDAIGDISIYMIDYCVKRDWSMQSIWESSKFIKISYGSTYALVRWLAHSQLKGEQNIRGGSEVHDAKLRSMLEHVVFKVSNTCQALDMSFVDVVQAVWDKVKQRNWVANPNTAHDVAGSSKS